MPTPESEKFQIFGGPPIILAGGFFREKTRHFCVNSNNFELSKERKFTQQNFQPLFSSNVSTNVENFFLKIWLLHERRRI